MASRILTLPSRSDMATPQPRLPMLRRDWSARSLEDPRSAIARQAGQMMKDLAERRESFRYEGATAGRRVNGWYTASSDANVELMGALVWLRNRARDLSRNNPYAAKALDELVGNTVGTGIVPQAKTGDAVLDRIIDNEWQYFAEQCDTPQRLDFYGMQALVMRSTAESGEEIVRFRPRLKQDNLRVPLQLQVLESDFLDQSRTMGLVNGHVMQGVQFDLIGRRIAYWLFSYHPGGLLIMNPRGGIVSQAVPADQIMHVYRVLRPGQVRGVPWFSPSMMAFRDLDDWCDAERVRKKIEACVTALITQPEGSQGQPFGDGQTVDPFSGKVLESFEPGMIEYLKPGQDVKFNNPQPTGGYREYKTTELQGIMAGIGLPYEIGTGDMENVNFSSWRGGMLGFRNTVENYRWLTLIPQFGMPVRRRFIDTLILLGKIPQKAIADDSINLYATQWTAPRFESVDPTKDAESAVRDIRMGRLTWFEAVLANGYDPMVQLEQIALFNKLVDKYGIVLDSDPRNVNMRGQEQSVATAEQDPTKPAPKAKPLPGKKPTPVKAGTITDEEDLGMIRELIESGQKRQQSQVNARNWESPVRNFIS